MCVGVRETQEVRVWWKNVQRADTCNQLTALAKLLVREHGKGERLFPFLLAYAQIPECSKRRRRGGVNSLKPH